MAADDETQDAVRRVLKERPPEAVPSGANARLRRRLDEEKPPRAAPVKRSAGRKRTSKTKR